MSIITITTTFNIDLEFRIAPFHKRLLAWLIDILVVGLYSLLIFRYVVNPLDLYERIGEGITIILVLLPVYLYHLVFELVFDGQSMGKMAMGIKVIDKNGNEASIGQYMLRWIFRLVDMVATLGIAALLSAILTRYNQRLGDIVAGTIVIDHRYKTGLHETIYLDLDSKPYTPIFDAVMRLSDRDINGIRNLLDTKGSSRDTETYMAQVADRIKDVLKIQTDLEPKVFLQQLLKDYNFITRK
jgi:uncharacterized RDD family membrane protein YckC